MHLIVFFFFFQVTLNFGPDFKYPPTDEDLQPVGVLLQNSFRSSVFNPPSMMV